MPDNQDYAELGRLLADPKAWTPAESATMRGLLRQQIENLGAVHPLDVPRRKSTQRLVDQIAEAIRVADSTD